MLVQAHDHRLPQQDASMPIAYSSIASAYIPPLPDATQYAHIAAHRHQRRARAAPYHVPAATSVASSSACLSSVAYQPDPPQVHAPQPVHHFLPVHALGDEQDCVESAPQPMPQKICSGAHGTILGPFSPRPDHPSDFTPSGELTATEMSATNSVTDHGSHRSSAPIADAPYKAAAPSVPLIRMPIVPKIPHVSRTRSSVSLSSPSDKLPLSPSGFTQTASELQANPPNRLPPAQNTFPTPSELLNELTEREQGIVPDARRTKRRKTPLDDYALPAGYVPTDPDLITSHDKKRHYLDCLEEYILYLHHQLRLVGVEPVPMERVSSGRGLTSRSIRTMIVHMQKTVAKLHAQKAEAAKNYDQLLERLGPDADKVAPSFTTSASREGVISESTSAPESEPTSPGDSYY